MRDDKFILGIVGSPSQCSAVMIAEDGSCIEIAFQKDKGLHFREMSGELLTHRLNSLCELIIDKTSTKTGIDTIHLINNIGSISCAIAGLDNRFDPSMFIGTVGELPLFLIDETISRIDKDFEISIHGIAEACWAGYFLGKEGIFARTGVGCSVYSRNEKGEHHLSNAWGFLPGDLGGGYHIGQQVLHQLTRFADQRADSDEKEFAARILELLGDIDVVDIFDQYRSLSQRYTFDRMLAISRLADKAFEIAAEGQSTANRILDSASKQLKDGIDACFTNVEFREARSPIAFGGSLFKGHPAYAKNLYNNLVKSNPNIHIEIKNSPIWSRTVGIALLSLQNSGKVAPFRLNERCNTFIESIEKDNTIKGNLIENPIDIW